MSYLPLSTPLCQTRRTKRQQVLDKYNSTATGVVLVSGLIAAAFIAWVSKASFDLGLSAKSTTSASVSAAVSHTPNVPLIHPQMNQQPKHLSIHLHFSRTAAAVATPVALSMVFRSVSLLLKWLQVRDQRSLKRLAQVKRKLISELKVSHVCKLRLTR